MLKILSVFILFLGFSFSQTIDEIEVFLIDSYVTTKVRPKFKLSFYTSENCKSKILLDGKYEIVISDTLTDEHKKEIDITQYKLSGNPVYYEVLVALEEKYVVADKIELALNFDMKEVQQMDYSLFKMCCIGGAVFGMPYPTYVKFDGKEYFGVTKEFALLSISGNDFNYPNGYIAAEYAHIFKSDKFKNVLRLGYKHIFVTPIVEYISPGVSGFTDFAGRSGISTEISVGVWKISNVFTLYGRYRYSFQPINDGLKYQELTIGLYSSFFSINL